MPASSANRKAQRQEWSEAWPPERTRSPRGSAKAWGGLYDGLRPQPVVGEYGERRAARVTTVPRIILGRRRRAPPRRAKAHACATTPGYNCSDSLESKIECLFLFLSSLLANKELKRLGEFEGWGGKNPERGGAKAE